jgi:hypothetical protein
MKMREHDVNLSHAFQQVGSLDKALNARSGVDQKNVRPRSKKRAARLPPGRWDPSTRT